MRCLAILCLLVLPVVAQAQTVEVQAQEANLEATASSYCPETAPPEPDLGKFFSFDVVPHDEQVDATMTSVCGAASSTANGFSAMANEELAIHLSTSATLDQFGGAIGSALINISFELHEAAAVVLEVLGANTSTVQDVGRNEGAVFLRPSVGDPIWGVQVFPLSLDTRWEGTLEPGRYSLEGFCRSERVWRRLGSVDFFQDGNGTADLSITLRFPDRTIVPTNDLSLGQLKASYLR